MRLAFVMLAGLLAFALPAGAAFAAGCTVPGTAEAETRAFAGAMNAERQRRGLSTLGASDRLQAAAQGHACALAGSAPFSHTGARGSTPKSRARRAGYRACLIAENIAAGQKDAAAVMEGWMNSDGHRRNILLRDVQSFGLALAKGRDGRPYWVLVLARPC